MEFKQLNNFSSNIKQRLFLSMTPLVNSAFRVGALVTLAITMHSAQAAVAVYGADSPERLANVVNTIRASAGTELGEVSGHRMCAGTPPCLLPSPTLDQLKAYKSVLVYSQGAFGDGIVLGDVLADYVDAGGTVVIATFGLLTRNSGSLGIGGRLSTGGYLPVTQGNQNQSNSQNMVPVLPSHPLLQGVAKFNGGTSSYRNMVNITPGSTLVATWDDANNTPLVALKKNVVVLNFFPVSSTFRTDFWDANTDGGRIMSNALNWTFSINPVTLSAGKVGSQYPATTLSVATSGGAPYAWSASGLPDGLSISNGGEITGTPKQHGTFTVQLNVKDSNVPKRTSSISTNLYIAPADLALNINSLPDASIGIPYSQNIVVTGGASPQIAVSGLPSGLVFDKSKNVISGIPDAYSSTPATVIFTISDTVASSQTLVMNLKINPSKLSMTVPSTLPDVKVGQPYNLQLNAVGGVAPYSWSATGLPAGLSIDKNGLVSGTTIDAKATSGSKAELAVTINVTDALNAQETQKLNLILTAAAVASPVPVPMLGYPGIALLGLLTVFMGALSFMRKEKST